MRAYIKEHPAEFGTTTVQSVVAGTSTTSPAASNLTEAERYAAQYKSKPAQTSYSTFISILRSIGNILGGLELSKETVLGGLVLILLLSNIYTFVNKGNGKTGRFREGDESGSLIGDEQVARAMRVLMRGRLEDPGAEARELMRILDGVEERARGLRGMLRGIAGEEVAVRGLAADLD
jgi:hypothetical protein